MNFLQVSGDPVRFEGYGAAERAYSGAPSQRATAVIAALREGPTDREQARGLRPVAFPVEDSQFNGASLRGDTLVLDFTEAAFSDVHMQGDSAGSGLLSALMANVFQAPGVAAVELQLNGDCGAFARRLSPEGSGDCIVRTEQQAAHWQSTTATHPPQSSPAPASDEEELYCGTSQPECTEPQ